MVEQEKKQTLSQKRKSHRATPCDNCGHPLASHHCLGTCKNKNCRCARFVSELKRRSREQGKSARGANAGNSRSSSLKTRPASAKSPRA
jgi:hypothetical protein